MTYCIKEILMGLKNAGLSIEEALELIRQRIKHILHQAQVSSLSTDPYTKGYATGWNDHSDKVESMIKNLDPL